MWEGDPDEFVAALHDAGFLDPDGKIHDWDQYTGRVVAQRESNRERQRRFREKQRQDVTGDATPEPDRPTPTITVTSPLRNGATKPNHTVPNQTIPPIGEDDPPTPLAPVPVAAAPPSSEPYRLFVAMCEETGADESAATRETKQKQLGIAKQIVAEGFTEDDVRKCVRYLQSQTWRQSIINLAAVKAVIGDWALAGKPATAERPNGRNPTPLRPFSKTEENQAKIRQALDIAEGRA